VGRRLFGTDGVRGPVGEVLTPELVLALGKAATTGLRAARPQVLVIRDTRESGEMLEAAVAAGIAAGGGRALLGGVLPTPAAPLLISRHGLDLGVVISASHNPFADNGVKFFAADGDKLSDEAEAQIEAVLGTDSPSAAQPGRVTAMHGTLEDYLRALHERFQGLDLAGRRILLDCANGATFRAAPEIFRRLGASIEAIAASPDGRNINEGCGSTHVEVLAAATAAGDFDAGFAFDGDGDRVLAADRDGAVVDGDEILALGALHLRDTGRLSGNGVAVTVMANYGFHSAMDAAGIEVATTAVGDRYVLEALRGRGWTFGGEQSGHVIELGFAPSGDGIATALLTLEALGDRDLADRGGMEKLPQRLVGVRVRDRGALASAGPLQEAIAAESAALEGRGRVLVRPSGTEPLVRVMVEAPTDEEAGEVCDRLAGLVEESLGASAGPDR